ncbi:DUF4058 family protein, partial [bacterium]|nr:DUF4058 family protein [bacterium]
QYISKRTLLLNGDAHFVELDFLRGFPRMPLDSLPACDYYALVSRVKSRPKAGLWPIGLRDALPAIPIPLRTPDPDISLDLQEVLHRVYDESGYAKYIYAGQPVPPLRKQGARGGPLRFTTPQRPGSRTLPPQARASPTK